MKDSFFPCISLKLFAKVVQTISSAEFIVLVCVKRSVGFDLNQIDAFNLNLRLSLYSKVVEDVVQNNCISIAKFI
jgi:hypothetical protein